MLLVANRSFLANHVRMLQCIAHNPGCACGTSRPAWASPNAAPTASSPTWPRPATSSSRKTAAFPLTVGVGTVQVEVTLTARLLPDPRRARPSAVHAAERHADNPAEAGHGRLKAWLWPTRGLKRHRSSRTIAAGYAFGQNPCRGHFDIAPPSATATGSACLNVVSPQWWARPNPFLRPGTRAAVMVNRSCAQTAWRVRRTRFRYAELAGTSAVRGGALRNAGLARATGLSCG